MGETCSRLVVGKGGLPPLLFCKSMLTFAKQSGGKPPFPTTSSFTFHELRITFHASRFTNHVSRITHHLSPSQIGPRRSKSHGRKFSLTTAAGLMINQAQGGING